MDVTVTKKDIEEIESNYDKLAGWLCNNFVSPIAVMVILQATADKVDEIRSYLTEEDEVND